MVGVVFVAFARPIAGLLAADAEVAAIAAACLRIVACSYVFRGFGLVTVVAFNGAGRHHHAHLDRLLRLLGDAAPARLDAGGPAGVGAPGVFATVAFCQTLMAAVGVLAFRRGGGKTRVL